MELSHWRSYHILTVQSFLNSATSWGQHIQHEPFRVTLHTQITRDVQKFWLQVGELLYPCTCVNSIPINQTHTQHDRRAPLQPTPYPSVTLLLLWNIFCPKCMSQSICSDGGCFQIGDLSNTTSMCLNILLCGFQHLLAVSAHEPSGSECSKCWGFLTLWDSLRFQLLHILTNTYFSRL